MYYNPELIRQIDYDSRIDRSIMITITTMT
jgi:hypothetical protein